MPELPVAFIKGDTVDNNVEYRDALAVNMYAVARSILNTIGYMINYFGLTSYADGEGIDRGGKWVSREGLEGHYRVSGTSLISVDATGAVSVLGTIPGTDQASIDYSFNNVAIVADGNLYYYNPMDGFRQIEDEEVGSPIDIVWIDGVFVLTDGENLYHSDPLDEESFLPLDFTNPQFVPDPSLGVGKNDDNELVAFGSLSAQYYQNVAGTNFLFQNIPRKAQMIGILGTHCKAYLNARWYVLGRREETSPSFHVVSLGSEKPFSSRETDKILATYTDEELALTTIDAFTVDNVSMIKVHLLRHVLLFNESIANSQGIDAAWSILKTDVTGDNVYRGRNMVFDPRNSKWLIGDKIDGRIGEMDRSSATHYGEIVEWLLFTPLLKLETLSIDELEMETIPGISPDKDATVFISVTQDARTYGFEWTQLYGDNQDYNQRFILRELGYVRNYIGFKFRGASRSRMSFAKLDLVVS